MLNTPALQTNFSPTSTAFWKQAYLDLATLMQDAGQTPYLQFGEVQWWYFPDDGSGMPYYDAYTTQYIRGNLRPRHASVHEQQRIAVGLSARSPVSAQR